MGAVVYPIPHKPMFGKGSVFLNQADPTTGLLTGYVHLGNCSKFELSITDDIAELYQSLNKSVSLIASALKQRKPEVAITGTDFNSDHRAISTLGTKTASVSTATPVVAEPLVAATTTKKGKYFRTAIFPIDTTTPPAVKQGASTLVLGTDYVIMDDRIGMIYFPTTSAVVETTAVTIDYTPKAQTTDQVNAAVLSYVQGSLLFSPDPTDGQKIMVEVWKINLNADGAVGFIAEDYGNWNMKGKILDDSANHPTCPYWRESFLP